MKRSWTAATRSVTLRAAAELLACLLLLPAAMPAQAPSTSGLYFSSPLRLSGGHETRTQGTRGGSPFLLLDQGFSFIRLAPRTEFSATYQPEFELFAEGRGMNAWNHAGGFRVAHRLTPRLKLEVGDSFVSTSDPSRRFSGASVFLLPRSRYNENSAYVNLDYGLSSQTSLSFRFDNTIATYSLPQGTTTEGLFDQMGNSWLAGISHRISPRGKLSGSYSFLKTRALGGRGDSSGPGYHHFSGGYKFIYSPDLLFEVSTGGIRGAGTSFLFSGQVERRLGTLWLGAGYSRHLSFYGGPRPVGGLPIVDAPFASGLLPTALYEVVSARVRGRLTRRIGADLETYFSRSNRRDLNTRSVSGRLRLDYKLNDRLVAFAAAEHYHQNLNEFLRIPVARRRYSGGLEVILSPAPNPIVAYRLRDSQAGSEPTPAAAPAAPATAKSGNRRGK